MKYIRYIPFYILLSSPIYQKGKEDKRNIDFLSISSSSSSFFFFSRKVVPIMSWEIGVDG